MLFPFNAKFPDVLLERLLVSITDLSYVLFFFIITIFYENDITISLASSLVFQNFEFKFQIFIQMSRYRKSRAIRRQMKQQVTPVRIYDPIKRTRSIR